MTENESLLQRAKEADKKDHCATAVELFIRYLKTDPESHSARFRLAENLRAIGLLREAELVLKSIKEIPAKKRWLFELTWGEIYMSRGEFAIAEHCFRRAVKLNRTSTVPWVFLGTCLSKQERFEEACDALSMGLAASRDLDGVYLNLGYCKRALRQYKAALQCFRKALEGSPEYPEAKEALEDMEQCVKLITED